MKRTNPQTGNLFHLGDLREDGRMFYGYTNRKKGNGFFVEIWIKPESRQSIRLKDLARKKNKKHDNPVQLPD
jgi:hypothetical protein